MTIKDIYERCDTINNNTSWYIIDENGRPSSKIWGVIFTCLVPYYDAQIYHFSINSRKNEVIVWLE